MKENNEKIVQNEVKDVEQTDNKQKKNSNRKTIVLIVIVLILIFAIGICIGALVSKKENVITNTENSTKTQENTQEQTTTSKKIDESRDWVYEADYLKEKEEKIKTSKENNLTVKSSEEIKLPYININSEDARIANKEIEVFAEKAYADFGKPLPLQSANEVITNDDCFSFTGYNYESYENNNILSIVIMKTSVSVPGDESVSYITYNFNLDTQKSVDIMEVAQLYGFKSLADLSSKLHITLKNSETMGEGLSPEYTVWDGKRYFVKDNKINVVVPGPVTSERTLEISPNVVEISSNATNSSINITNKNILIKEDFFSLELPSSWAGKYKYDIATGNEADSYVFSTKSDNAELFTVIRSNKPIEGQYGTTLLKKTNLFYYYFSTPTDTPSNTSEYAEMYKDIESNIRNTIKIK